MNIDDYYLNPNLDGPLHEFLEKKLKKHLKAEEKPAVNLDKKKLTLLAIMDHIDAVLDEENNSDPKDNKLRMKRFHALAKLYLKIIRSEIDLFLCEKLNIKKREDE